MFRSITILLLLLSFFSTTEAQTRRKPTFYLNTGITFPSAPREFHRYWDPGPNFGIGIGYRATDNIILLGRLDYQGMTHNADKLRADLANGDEVDFRGGTATILTAMADFKFSMGPNKASLTPYLVFGAGYLRLSLTEMTTTYQGRAYRRSVDPKSAAVLALGLGCDFRLTYRVTLFVEGKYAIGYTDGGHTMYFPLKTGIAFR